MESNSMIAYGSDRSRTSSRARTYALTVSGESAEGEGRRGWEYDGNSDSNPANWMACTTCPPVSGWVEANCAKWRQRVSSVTATIGTAKMRSDRAARPARRLRGKSRPGPVCNDAPETLVWHQNGWTKSGTP